MALSYRQHLVRAAKEGYAILAMVSGEAVRWDPLRPGHRWPWVDANGQRYDSCHVAAYDKITGERYTR